MTIGASFHILSSSTALCVFIVGTSHNPFISPNLPFLVSSSFFQSVCHSLFFSFSLFSQFLILPTYPLLRWLPLLLKKEESVLPASLKVRAPLVLHKESLMRSLGVPLFPYETPGTPLVCSSLKRPMARPLHPLMPGYSLGKQVLSIPLKSQTLERFLISRSDKDLERQFPSFLIQC